MSATLRCAWRYWDHISGARQDNANLIGESGPDISKRMVCGVPRRADHRKLLDLVGLAAGAAAGGPTRGARRIAQINCALKHCRRRPQLSFARRPQRQYQISTAFVT